MKKSVIILIAIIYVASIVVVSFYGMAFEIFDPVVYVEKVELEGDNLQSGEYLDPPTNHFLVLYPDSDGIYRYQIKAKVTPSDATNKKLNYVFDENDAVTIDSTGLVTITEPTAVTIHIISTDGTNQSVSIQIYAKRLSQ